MNKIFLILFFLYSVIVADNIQKDTLKNSIEEPIILPEPEKIDLKIEDRKKVDRRKLLINKKNENLTKLKLDEKNKRKLNINLKNNSNIKKEDKINKLILLIEKMNEEEAKLKKKEIEKKKKKKDSNIIFTPLKSIRVGGRIYVDVKVSFKNSNMLNKVINNTKLNNKKPVVNSIPSNNKNNRLSKTKQNRKNINYIPSRIYTLTVGDQIDNWKVIRATDRFIVFKNIDTNVEIKEYY